MKIFLCVVILALLYRSEEAQIQCGEDYDAKLSVWVDDAPGCIADASYCTQAGLDYVCEEIFDTGNPNDTCQTGMRVRCSYPDIPTPLVDTPATMLKVVSYNVWELRYIYSQNGQRERTCRILPELVKMRPEVDVIIFNEVYMGGCFSSGRETLTLRDILTEYGFTEYTRTVGLIPSAVQPENGGVFIASKWPISRERLMVFEAYERTTSDSISQKGVVYARIDKTVASETQRYNVFGTQMQSSNRRNSSLVRVAQAQEMYEFQKSQNIPASEPVIYGGGFNADRLNDFEHSEEIIGELNATVPEITGSISATYDEDNNDVFGRILPGGAYWYDYAVYSNEHMQPGRTSLRVLRPRAVPFTVCVNALSTAPAYPESRFCVSERTITDLSDHYAVMGTFDFGDGDWSTSTATTPTTQTTEPTEQNGGTTKPNNVPESTTGSGAEYWSLSCTLMVALYMTIILVVNAPFVPC